MTDKEYVIWRFPDAGAIMLNRGLYYISDQGHDGDKMSPGNDLSEMFRRESEAWSDAARKIREKAGLP